MAQEKTITIAVDVMGAKHPPEVMLKGVLRAHQKLPPNANFLICGDHETICGFLHKHPELQNVSEVGLGRHPVIDRNDNARAVFRKLKDDTTGSNSLVFCVKSVAQGDANIAVSAGNTTAQVMVCNQYLEEIEGCKPAIAAEWPTDSGRRTLVLDNGASPDVSAVDLFAFARMGSVAAQVLFGIASPEVKLLTNGDEAIKGNAAVKGARTLLLGLSDGVLNFGGNIRGSQVLEGMADVVVTGGHEGNIALTTMEGVSRSVKRLVKKAAATWGYIPLILAGVFSPLALPSLICLSPCLLRLCKSVDHQSYNGGPILGFKKGILVKSHGDANEVGFAEAIARAYWLADANVAQKLIERLVVD